MGRDFNITVLGFRRAGVLCLLENPDQKGEPLHIEGTDIGVFNRKYKELLHRDRIVDLFLSNLYINENLSMRTIPLALQNEIQFISIDIEGNEKYMQMMVEDGSLVFNEIRPNLWERLR